MCLIGRVRVYANLHFNLIFVHIFLSTRSTTEIYRNVNIFYTLRRIGLMFMLLVITCRQHCTHITALTSDFFSRKTPLRIKENRWKCFHESNPSDVARAENDTHNIIVWIAEIERWRGLVGFSNFPGRYIHKPCMRLFSREMSEPQINIYYYTAASAPVFRVHADVLGIVFRAERATITNPKRSGPAFLFSSQNTTANCRNLRRCAIRHYDNIINWYNILYDMGTYASL